ncbi:hypothetical protein Acid345_4696 [Candidatus Koribacter versatilis Ellin345]|uniref:Uncharacterized protein n=1 Tax=Koribacter versatilis (strain Ellin345) TaxID=204669 RepID=Q1IHF4_KORVE|nr:hypothetical protein [Candidatus Koribacter versatilis]ABF43696.1 hypothetical protein Acid345_4696 [Candidatus Koribacter versatilis Ellin345]
MGTRWGECPIAICANRDTLFIMLRVRLARVAVVVLSLAVAVGVGAQDATQHDPHNPQLTIRSDGKNVYKGDTENEFDAQKYLTREFGPGFKLAKDMPVLLGDMDGDGREDAAFIVTGGSPMLSAGAFDYKVIDPYDGYWSFADPKLNMHVPMTDPGKHYYICIAHDWKGEHPKAKFVIFNLPFKSISLTPTNQVSGPWKKSKKIVAALATEESDGQQGAVVWNGSDYKFIQLGNTED